MKLEPAALRQRVRPAIDVIHASLSDGQGYYLFAMVIFGISASFLLRVLAPARAHSKSLTELVRLSQEPYRGETRPTLAAGITGKDPADHLNLCSNAPLLAAMEVATSEVESAIDAAMATVDPRAPNTIKAAKFMACTDDKSCPHAVSSFGRAWTDRSPPGGVSARSLLHVPSTVTELMTDAQYAALLGARKLEDFEPLLGTEYGKEQSPKNKIKNIYFIDPLGAIRILPRIVEIQQLASIRSFQGASYVYDAFGDDQESQNRACPIGRPRIGYATLRYLDLAGQGVVQTVCYPVGRPTRRTPPAMPTPQVADPAGKPGTLPTGTVAASVVAASPAPSGDAPSGSAPSGSAPSAGDAGITGSSSPAGPVDAGTAGSSSPTSTVDAGTAGSSPASTVATSTAGGGTNPNAGSSGGPSADSSTPTPPCGVLCFDISPSNDDIKKMLQDAARLFDISVVRLNHGHFIRCGETGASPLCEKEFSMLSKSDVARLEKSWQDRVDRGRTAVLSAGESAVRELDDEYFGTVLTASRASNGTASDIDVLLGRLSWSHDVESAWLIAFIVSALVGSMFVTRGVAQKSRRAESTLIRGLPMGVIEVHNGKIVRGNDRAEELLHFRLSYFGASKLRSPVSQDEVFDPNCVILLNLDGSLANGYNVVTLDHVDLFRKEAYSSRYYIFALHSRRWISVLGSPIITPGQNIETHAVLQPCDNLEHLPNLLKIRAQW